MLFGFIIFGDRRARFHRIRHQPVVGEFKRHHIGRLAEGVLDCGFVAERPVIDNVARRLRMQLRRTRLGLALLVIGEDETVARQVGINVPFAKVAVFILSAIPMTLAGALMALDTKAGLKEGQTVLVLGAGGPLGLAAVAVAKALGATVIAAANGAARLTHAKEMGAGHVLDAGLVSVATAVEEQTAGRGADVVFDPVGGDVSVQALQALATEGRYVLAGFAGGRPTPLDAGQLFARGGTVLSANTVLAMQRDPAAAGEALARVVAWVEQGVFAPRIAAQFAFADVQHAFDYLAGRRGSGATIVTIAAP